MILQTKIKPPSRSENTKNTPLISFKKISWSRHITLQGIHIRDWFLVLSEKSNWWQIDLDLINDHHHHWLVRVMWGEQLFCVTWHDFLWDPPLPRLQSPAFNISIIVNDDARTHLHRSLSWSTEEEKWNHFSFWCWKSRCPIISPSNISGTKVPKYAGFCNSPKGFCFLELLWSIWLIIAQSHGFFIHCWFSKTGIQSGIYCQ